MVGSNNERLLEWGGSQSLDSTSLDLEFVVEGDFVAFLVVLDNVQLILVSLNS